MQPIRRKVEAFAFRVSSRFAAILAPTYGCPFSRRSPIGDGMHSKGRLFGRHALVVHSMALAAVLVLPKVAQAHVKWFCAFDVSGQPRGLESILCADFEQLVAIAVVVLLAGCLLENTVIGKANLRALDRATAWLRENSELVIRGTCGFFFVAVWTIGGVLLTPELKTSSPYVPILHIVIAAALIWRWSLPVSAMGIVVLYGIAIHDYGVFHLMDYPVFLGVAAYLALTGLQRDLFGARPLDVMRWAAGITLMWASIEKWAYPEWTYPLFITHPAMSMGYDVAYFMRAAGVIEFTLAFALMWTPLVRRSAAIMLAAIFISAIPEFGKIDAIGHSAIIAVLFVVAADNATSKRLNRRWQPLLAPLGYGLSLAGFLLVYYAAHTTLFGPAAS